MTDYLLVHGAGQGAWSWGQVWGYLTAPQEHPPRLYVPRRANRVYPLDLPGHGADADGDTAEVRLEECVHAIIRAVEREGLKDVVLVGHGFGGGLRLKNTQSYFRHLDHFLHVDKSQESMYPLGREQLKL